MLSRRAGNGLRVMSVGRICQREVDLAEAGESVQVAAERMHQRAVGTLVVVDEWQHPIGIVTDRDLAVRVLAGGKDPQLTEVQEVMTRQLHFVMEETPIEDALKLMRSGRFRRLPVVDRSGKLAGLVAADDIICLLSEELGEIGQLLERESPREIAKAGII